eukprot:9469446-Pyramimonas_sp.AAC.1
MRGRTTAALGQWKEVASMERGPASRRAPLDGPQEGPTVARWLQGGFGMASRWFLDGPESAQQKIHHPLSSALR